MHLAPPGRRGRLAAVLAVVGAVVGMDQSAVSSTGEADPFVIVLGIAQDGGVPQAGCRRECCADRWGDERRRRHVACLGIVDPRTSQRWIIDATPDFREQLRMLEEVLPSAAAAPSGVLLTHAHMGHYTGLVHLGHEAMGARAVPVYAMPRMEAFLEKNGPWDQLVRFGNVALRPMAADEPVRLNPRITVTPFLVPHRDEYSETVGFRIDGPNRSALYIPDIDKWERWDRSVEEAITGVDRAYLDGTFYDANELPGRDLTKILHPFISESLVRFRPLPGPQRSKVRFIHLNHTNPALRAGTPARRAIEEAGFHVAQERERFGL